MNALLNDAETLDFIRRQAQGARYVTSVCTGALVLGAAGLLKGKRAATHWMSREMLERIRRDAGCRAGRDRRQCHHRRRRYGGDRLRARGRRRGLRRGTRASDPAGIEYDPHPPFDAGSPERAEPRWSKRPARRRETTGRAPSRGRQGRRARLSQLTGYGPVHADRMISAMRSRFGATSRAALAALRRRSLIEMAISTARSRCCDQS